MKDMKNIQEVLAQIDSHLRDVYINSDALMCIYNTTNNKIIHTNPATTARVGLDSVAKIGVVFSSETEKFITLDEIPCRMKILTHITKDLALASVYAAHTKKWSQSSDLVSFTDVMTDGVWEWFPEVGFEYMSERFWEILGYSQREMPESPSSWMNFLHPDDKAVALKQFEDHVRTKGHAPYRLKARYTSKSNREVIVLCQGTVVEWLPDGRAWRVLGIHTDVTQMIKRDSLEAKSKFISRMSHEIRSPICTILNECELLDKKAQTAVIEDTCRQLLSLADDILSIDSQSFNEVKLKPQQEDLSSVLSKCVKRHRVEAKKKGLRLRLMFDDLPDQVSMDAPKFNQVLDNLLINAIKYSETGSILVDVGYNDTLGVCNTRVIDEGAGMESGFHTIAFEELVQGNNTMIGAGLGLAISRRFAKAMGGNVIIEKSSPREGTTMLFTCHLPLGIGQDPSDVPQQNPSDVPQQKKSRILLVDDLLTNRQILRRKIKSIENKCGVSIEVVEAVDGSDAVQKFTECQGEFHLVLMDCHMPILDGFQATLRIHEVCDEFNLKAVPVVAVTASVSMDIHRKCLSAGMKYVVTKPYSENDLIASLRSCIYNVV